MKKYLMTVLIVFVSMVSYGQKYISTKTHINTINNQYFESVGNLYITIEGDKVLFTNKKGDKVFEEYKLGEIKEGDVVTKYSLEETSSGKKQLVRRSKDTFTEKSSKMVYELEEIKD